jgi:hypothetical protein
MNQHAEPVHDEVRGRRRENRAQFHGFQRGLAQNEEGDMGILTLGDLWLGSTSRQGCSGGSSLCAKMSDDGAPWWFSSRSEGQNSVMADQ